MAVEHEVLIQEVVRLSAEGAPPEQVVEKATAAKAAIVRYIDELQRAVNILDGIVPYVAPGTYWEIGWKVTPKVSFGTSRKTDRPSRVREIALKLYANGAATVKTEDIAEELRSEGDTASIKDLATAAGNILTRTGSWRRAHPGVYEVIADQEVAKG